jgi:hypothetical protein
MTISILKAEPFYPLGKPLPRPVSDLVKKVDEMIRPGIFRKADGTLETRGYETPPASAKPAESSLPAKPNALAGADGWIEWAGGECPIPHAKRGEYEVRWQGNVGESAVKCWTQGLAASELVGWEPMDEEKVGVVAYRLIPTEAA